jgi:hypothetical protein
MREERDQPPEPGLFDKFNLAMSTGRDVDGLWIGSYWDLELLPRIESALLLLQQHSPLQYARVLRDLDRIWIYLLPYAAAEYHASINACVIDKRYIASLDTSVEELATTILHEATHARLDRCGIKYEEARRTRIEAICCRRELAFATRLPDSALLQEEITRRLNWYKSNPDYFSDANFHELRTHGEREMLRHIDVPDWLIRVMPAIRSLIGRAHRLIHLFRFARS